MPPPLTHLPIVPGTIGGEPHPLALQVSQQFLLIYRVYWLLMILGFAKLGAASVSVRVAPHLAPHALGELHLRGQDQASFICQYFKTSNFIPEFRKDDL